MTGNPDAPDAGRVPAAARPTDPPGEAGRPRSGPVTEFALVAAGLGLVVYLLGFVDDIGSSASLAGPLLLGGGLLAGSVALSTVGARVLVPAAVATVTGALLLLQDVVGGAGSGVAVGAAVLALFEAAAAAAAAFLHAGVVRAPRPRQRKPAAAPYPPQPGYPPFPGQQQFPGQYPGQQYPGQPQPGAYPGQPYPGSYPGRPGEPPPGDQYAGEHAYAQYARYGAPYGVPGSLAPEATAVHRSGAHRATPAAAGEVAVTATGSHAAAPEAVDARPDGADDRTRAFPAVTEER